MLQQARRERRVLLFEEQTTAEEARERWQWAPSLPGIALDRISNLQSAISSLENRDYDLLLYSSDADSANGLSFLQNFQSRHFGIPIVVMSDSNEIQKAVEAMKLGAVDYLVRDSTTPGALTETILEAIERSEDVKSREEEIERLRRLTVTDPLTGLFNRRYLFRVIEKEMNRCERSGANLAFAMVDIDLFKSLNDRYGHLAGDSILRRFSSYLSTWVRAMDIICRYGGDEFGIILPNTDSQEAIEVGRRLCTKLGQAVFPVEGLRLRISVSIGVASIDHHRTWRGIDLIRHADEALYCAKQGGRNQISLWTKEAGESKAQHVIATENFEEQHYEHEPVRLQGK